LPRYNTFCLLRECCRQTVSITGTIDTLLKKMSPDDDSESFDKRKTIQNIKVVLDGSNDPKRAYFVCDEGLSFRHAGDGDKKPSQVFVTSLDTYDKKVIILYSASGSGKTVELAASSVTRGAHIAFVLSVTEDAEPGDHDHMYAEQTVDDQVVYKTLSPEAQSEVDKLVNRKDMHKSLRDLDPPQRKERLAKIMASYTRMKKKLKPLVSKSKGDLRKLLEAAKMNDEPLRVVVALDEAASCPNIVRSITRDPTNAVSLAFSECIYEQCDWSDPVDVKVSIAGTGVAPSTVGSIPERFAVVAPTRETRKGMECVIDIQLKGLGVSAVGRDGEQQLRATTDVQHTLPVVAALMENGRMGSIAIEEMKGQPTNVPVCEAKLAKRIVASYMWSNGMAELVVQNDAGVQKNAQKVAALALAVHLFGSSYKTETPRTMTEVQKWASDMTFGFPAINAYVEKGASLQRIVQKYGLLEPGDNFYSIGPNTTIAPPLRMKAAQQLVAAYMLGVSLKGLLELTPLGFEFLSTHFLKCAIAASNAIAYTKRPSLMEALRAVGFELDEIGTDDSVKNVWNDTMNWKVVGFANQGRQNEEYVSQTIQLAVELRIIEDEGEEEAENEGDKDSASKMLQIDSAWGALLLSMVAKTNNDDHFSLPVACVNYGNSPLPDGFVVFFAKNQNTGVTEKWTIMIQAKDYYKTSISTKKLNEHAERAQSSILDQAFGARRLLCVASGHPSLFVKRSGYKRKFIPYSLNEAGGNQMMPDLLAQMARDEDTRVVKYASFVSEGSRKLKRPHP